jgi:nitrile hydratase subunit alpha
MVFEKLKAAFCKHLTHTRFISRKVGFSRRCFHVRRDTHSSRPGRAHARDMGEPKIGDQTGDAGTACLLAGNKLRFGPHKNCGSHRARGCIFVPLSWCQTELLVDMKADTHDLAQEKEHVHGHQTVPSDLALRVKALESLLVEKGLVDPAALDALIDTYEHKIGPRNGARVVARAWIDPAYKERLLTDATAAIGELGYTGAQGEHMIVVENGPKVHNLVVCTLCSCYPWPVLGLPPVWYKSAPYRSRAVIDPRGVLREFGLEPPEGVEIRVWDSTAEVRYLVLPERPAGSEKLSEEELARLVTRDAMVGVAKVNLPQAGANL